MADDDDKDNTMATLQRGYSGQGGGGSTSCAQVDSITSQMQNAGLNVPQAYLQQQLQLEFQLLQQQRSGGNASVFLPNSSPYLDLAASGASTAARAPVGSDEMDMTGMLPVTWVPQQQQPQPRTTVSDPSDRWRYQQQRATTQPFLFANQQQLNTKAPVMADVGNVLYPVMELPPQEDSIASSDNNKTGRNFESFPTAGGSPAQLFQKTEDSGGTVLLQTPGINPMYSAAPQAPMVDSAGFVPQPLASNNQFADQEAVEAIFQPVMDAANLEPLDDNSLEFLVSSLTHINSELNQYSEEDEDDADDYRYGAESKFGRQQLQTPDFSESFSDSSASSMSPHGSPYDRYPTISSSQQRSQLQATTTSGGSLDQALPKKKPKRIRRLCIQPNCGKRARSQGLCIAHGGGRRCIVEGCEKSSQGGNMCIKHGGGKRCSVQGCNKAAQTHSLCKAHGGGPRCQVEGCDKSSQGGGFCRSHGGGKRCAAEGCDKGTQRGDFCALHGGSRFCEVSGCRRNDRGGGLCAHHGGGKRCGILNCKRPCRRNGFCSTHLRLLGREVEAGDSPDEIKSWV